MVGRCDNPRLAEIARGVNRRHAEERSIPAPGSTYPSVPTSGASFFSGGFAGSMPVLRWM